VDEKGGTPCMKCGLSVYTPAETANEYVADFHTLIELMTEELADAARRKIKKMRIRDYLAALRFQNTSLDILHGSKICDPLIPRICRGAHLRSFPLDETA
jgi:hypothetical protein